MRLFRRGYVRVTVLESCETATGRHERTVSENVSRMSLFALVRVLWEWWKFHFAERNRVRAISGDPVWYAIEKRREIRFEWM